jgi:small GTP-binding protein
MTILADHEAAKAALLAELGDLAGIAEAAGLKTLHADLVETRIPKLQEGRFHLVVLGEFNHGKSTFVNALLGADVLPTGITPTTATINHVVHAKKARARAVLEDGREETIDPKKLSDWVTVDGEHTKGVRYVEVGWPSAILEDKVTLVDTPGVNDLNEQRAEVTYGYVPRADAVIFLLDAGQALKESERAFLTSRILERSRDRMIFVVGKIDLLDDSDREEVVSYVRDHLARIVAEPPIFAVSAKRALAGDEKRGRMKPLLDHLGKVLTDERGRVLLDNAAGDGLRTAGYLRQNLGVKRQALDLSVSELEERVAKVRAQLAATQQSLGKLHDRIRAEGEAVKAQIRLDLEQFATRFETIVPVQIDAADSGDVKRYLALFIQDKFKEWAENEGEKCGALLERLAEEVIAVTNENAREATAALASHMGAGDSRFEVEVDTFKYDVSVYAVGALGTTILLFVNTLVGGLLTLAAPILAIVLQSRVSAEIKDQAKQRAPKAIREASVAIAPQFAKIVDDFCRRLGDFVTSAGDKLYGGITEILDRAITDRRSQGDATAPLIADVDQQLARLDDVTARLTATRAKIWGTGPAPQPPEK